MVSRTEVLGWLPSVTAFVLCIYISIRIYNALGSVSGCGSRNPVPYLPPYTAHFLIVIVALLSVHWIFRYYGIVEFEEESENE